MEYMREDYFDNHKQFRVNSKKLATAFWGLAFIVFVAICWWLKLVGITVTGEAFCGQEEHSHSEACYSETLICTLEEHVHTKDCFPDKNADVENAADWLATFEQVEITNNIPENLVAIALSQNGYEESSRNFEYDDEGNRNGYTRYGEWYGNPYGKWNTMFVSFCLQYSNINGVDELRSAGAETMRLAWQNRNIYSATEEYKPQRGNLVFFDDDKNGAADSVAIVLSVGEDALDVVIGDSDNKVEIKNIDLSNRILGYGLTSSLSFAKDMEYKEETVDTEDLEETELVSVQAFTMSTDTNANITYITDLASVLQNVTLKTQDGDKIENNGTVYVGQSYIISLEFAEQNTTVPWIQFEQGEGKQLYYQIPENIHCEPTEWQPITAQTEGGTITDVGHYMINEDGQLIVEFYGDFVGRFSNVTFNIDLNATIGTAGSDTTTEVVFNDKINVDLTLDGGAGINATKKHGKYNREENTIEYTIRVEATHGVVKDLVLDDEIWENHYALRDTIVVTDLEGNVLEPQPVVSDHPRYNEGLTEGFRLTGFPDFAAGEGYLITYKTKIHDEFLNQESVGLWNGLKLKGEDSKGEEVSFEGEDWVNVDLEIISKDGKQTVIKDANRNSVEVIEWEVVIKNNDTNLNGTVIVDTLGEGLAYYTEQPILIKRYDAAGNQMGDIYLSWNNVTVDGSSMKFSLPEGCIFDIFYYTTYEVLDAGEQKQFTNNVSATINGKQEAAGGVLDVVAFIPKVSKSASGNDGEYVYFTIEADVPGVIKDWGGFYLTDMAAFWSYAGNSAGYLYVENQPQNLVITAVTKNGQTISFTPYVIGGPVENTYMLIAPANNGTQHHSFNILFNTSETGFASSKWMLNEDATLKITYKLPFDAKTGIEWTGELTGDKTLGEVLLEDQALANEVYFNYTDVIQSTASTTYEYSPQIIKDSVVNEDGTIDYKVIFRNSVPGKYGNEGYLNSETLSAYFIDTFDEKLKYVEGSLTVICYDPWRPDLWLNKYTYHGSIAGNTIELHANQFNYVETNADAEAVGWDIQGYLAKMATLEQYYKSMNNGGNYVFTYTLKVKDEYLNSTDQNKYRFDNTAEVRWDTNGTSGPAKDRVDFETGLLDKQVAQENNKLDFAVYINRNALDILEGTDTLTIEDTMTQNLSLYWDSIKLSYEGEDGEWIDFDSEESTKKYSVIYDQNTNKLTFTVPDQLHIKIDYTTLITERGAVSVENTVNINGSAKVTDIVDATFQVDESSGGASGSMDDMMLIKQDGDTNQRLPNVTFLLYGPVGDPSAVLPEGVDATIRTESAIILEYIGSYTTDSDGTVRIATQYLTRGGPYALVEMAAPEGYIPLEKPVCFYYYETDPTGMMPTVTTLLAIENYKYGFVLPETGGMGPLPFTMVGVAVATFAALYYIIRKKRERRSN